MVYQVALPKILICNAQNISKLVKKLCHLNKVFFLCNTNKVKLKWHNFFTNLVIFCALQIKIKLIVPKKDP